MNNEIDPPETLTRRSLNRALLPGMAGLALGALAARTGDATASNSHLSFDDQIQIERLLYTYGIGVDYLDPITFGSLFAPGAKMEGRAGEGRITFEGDIAAQVIDLHRNAAELTMHQVLNHVHTVQGSKATGVTYGIATWIVKSKTGDLSKLDQYMRYYDDLVRHDRRWLFMKRRMEVLFTTNTPLSTYNGEPRSGKAPPM